MCLGSDKSMEKIIAARTNEIAETILFVLSALKKVLYICSHDKIHIKHYIEIFNWDTCLFILFLFIKEQIIILYIF
jgi:hypothetical protein